MAKNTAQFMLERLSEWGIKRIYGYPGDGINGLLGAFHEVGDKVELNIVRKGSAMNLQVEIGDKNLSGAQ